jgi:hypothetical protein
MLENVAQVIRDTRLQLGLNIEDIAQRTYIKGHYLEALEAADLSKLPDMVYVHGYIRQVSKVLNLDGNALVAHLTQNSPLYTAQPSSVPGATFIPAAHKRPWHPEALPSALAQDGEYFMREAERYADAVLVGLENDIAKTLKIVRNGREYLRQKRQNRP